MADLAAIYVPHQFPPIPLRRERFGRRVNTPISVIVEIFAACICAHFQPAYRPWAGSRDKGGQMIMVLCKPLEGVLFMARGAAVCPPAMMLIKV